MNMIRIRDFHLRVIVDLCPPNVNEIGGRSEVEIVWVSKPYMPIGDASNEGHTVTRS